MPDPRMFTLFWVQQQDGDWVLDAANSPPQAPFTLRVSGNGVVVEWRHDVEEVMNEPDTMRWLALRLIEAATLADAQTVGLLLSSWEDATDDAVEVLDGPPPEESGRVQRIFDEETQQWRPRRQGE